MQVGVHRVAGWSAKGVIAEAGRAACLRLPRTRLSRLHHAWRDGPDLAQGPDLGAELVEERS